MAFLDRRPNEVPQGHCTSAVPGKACARSRGQRPCCPHTRCTPMTPGEVRMYQRILVPFDNSAASRCGLEQAIRLARLTRGTIRLLHVVDELGHVTGFETAETYHKEVRPGLWRRGRQ